MHLYYLVGFDALGYQEHLDYGLVQSTNPEFNKATVRVNVFRDHRQTIQVCVLITFLVLELLIYINTYC